MSDLVDILTPAAPGALMRTATLIKPGSFRLSRRDCELYSVQIFSSGDWGKMQVTDGTGRDIFSQLSTFTGSFWLGAGCKDGLIVRLYVLSMISVGLNWRERDRKLV